MSDLNFDIRKSDIFEESFGFDHYFWTQKIIFVAAQMNYVFVTRCAGNKHIIFLALLGNISGDTFLMAFQRTIISGPCDNISWKNIQSIEL